MLLMENLRMKHSFLVDLVVVAKNFYTESRLN